jgi:3-deoxy-D-manno-octulosonic acid (KDO) 8-phosphate synthase
VWQSDPGGELQYTLIAPIDAAELRERFSFSVSIQVWEGGFIKDRPTWVAVIQTPAHLTFCTKLLTKAKSAASKTVQLAQK